MQPTGNEALLAFEGALAGLLRRPAPDGVVRYPVTRQTSVKDAIEALGPPHTEVYGLDADGVPVPFSHRLLPGQGLRVAPAVFPIDVTVPTLLRPHPLPRLAFLVDANAGKLATLLRLLGFDTFFDRSLTDAAVAATAAGEGRVVLSRDLRLLKRSAIVYGRLIRANDPTAQLKDVLRAFGLGPPYKAFSRCLRCNAALAPVAKAVVLDRLLPKTKRYFEEFHRCPACDRIYWPGSHHDHMAGWVAELTRAMSPAQGPGGR